MKYAVKLIFFIARVVYRVLDPRTLLLSPFIKIKDLALAIGNFAGKIKKLHTQTKDFIIMDRMLNYDNIIEFKASMRVLQNQSNKFKSKCKSFDKYISYVK